MSANSIFTRKVCSNVNMSTTINYSFILKTLYLSKITVEKRENNKKSYYFCNTEHLSKVQNNSPI